MVDKSKSYSKESLQEQAESRLNHGMKDAEREGIILRIAELSNCPKTADIIRKHMKWKGNLLIDIVATNMEKKEPNRGHIEAEGKMLLYISGGHPNANKVVDGHIKKMEEDSPKMIDAIRMDVRKWENDLNSALNEVMEQHSTEIKSAVALRKRELEKKQSPEQIGILRK